MEAFSSRGGSSRPMRNAPGVHALSVVAWGLWVALLVAVWTLPIVLAACNVDPSTTATSADQTVLRGRSLYQASCERCHEEAANGTGRLAPPHGPTGHTWHHPDGQIVDIILGRLQYAGRTMPSFEGQMSEDDARAVLAFLKTNWTPAQRKFQEEVTRDPNLPSPPRERAP